MEKRMIALIMGIISFIYYVALSAKQYTWVFVSGDSGSWLASANQWMLPQPYGSPLYISLTRLFGFLPNQPVTLTILLSSLPSAITVTLVYLIVKQLTNKVWYALTASLVLLGAGVFLTQSTILEQYALAVSFATLAFYFYVLDKRKLTALALGLGTAVHIFVLPIAVFWFVLEYKHTRLKPIAIYLATGVLPYSLIPVLMHFDGGLTFARLWEYWTGTAGAIVGTLSIFDAPNRILTIAQILLMSLGLAIVPLYIGLRKPYDTKKLVLVMIVVFTLWYHLTSLDPITWTFLSFSIPSIAILVGIGLSKLSLKHTYAVVACALILICANSVFLNANVLTQKEPLAMTYYQELHALPDGSAIFAIPGRYSFGVLYVISEGKELRLVEAEDADYFAGTLDKLPETLQIEESEGMIHKIK